MPLNRLVLSIRGKKRRAAKALLLKPTKSPKLRCAKDVETTREVGRSQIIDCKGLVVIVPLLNKVHVVVIGVSATFVVA